MGEAKAKEEASATPMMNGRGSTPRSRADSMQKGNDRAAAALLLISSLRTMVPKYKAARVAVGPQWRVPSTRTPANSSATPDCSSALPTPNDAAMATSTGRSTDFRARAADRQPDRTIAPAATMAASMMSTRPLRNAAIMARKMAAEPDVADLVGHPGAVAVHGHDGRVVELAEVGVAHHLADQGRAGADHRLAELAASLHDRRDLVARVGGRHQARYL